MNTKSEAEYERRGTDKRIDSLEAEIKNVVAANGTELNSLHAQYSESKTWQAGHDAKDEERWKANGEKWDGSEKRFDGIEVKLNAIIGTSFATLLTVAGFFIVLYIDRQEDKKTAHREVTSLHAQQYENQ